MATVARPQSRSLTRGESWQRIGAKIAELPTAYTGSKNREAPADWFKAPPKIEWQAPKALSPEQHTTLVGKLKGVIQSNRQDAIAKAKETRQLVAVHGIKDKFTMKRRTGDLILPPDAPPGAVNRAYNHAAMLALHDFGVLDYDFWMSDSQKEELTPLIPFMRYTRRRLWNEMRTGDLKGASQPYRAEFGKPFADQRRDKRTGAVRLRLRPNDVLVKAFDETKVKRDEDGKFASKGGTTIAGTLADLKESIVSPLSDESKVKRDDDGKFAPKNRKLLADLKESIVSPLRSPVNQGILGSVGGAVGIMGLNAGIVAAAAMPRGTPAIRRVLRGLARSGGTASLLATSALAVGSVAMETTAAIRRRPEDGWVGPSWSDRLNYAGNMVWPAGAGAVGLYYGLTGHGRGLTILARTLPKLGSNAVAAIVPSLGQSLKIDRASRLAAVRSAIKANPGTIVWRGAPATHDFTPIPRGYTAVYAATKKKVTRGYGAGQEALGSVTAFKVSPKAKLLELGLDFPEDAISTDKRKMPKDLVPFYERLVAAGHNGSWGSTKRDFSGLSALHTNPTEAQKNILEEAGYHGTIGRSRNVALFDTKMLTPLYAQDRAFGTVTFPKKPLTKAAPSDCIDDRVATQVQEADRILSSAAPQPGAARRRIDPHVASVLADVDRLLGPAPVPPVPETPELRLKRNAMVADLRIPLADVLRRAA